MPASTTTTELFLLALTERYGEARLAGLVLVDSSVGEDPASGPGGGFAAELRRDRRAAMEDFVRAIFKTPQSEAVLVALTRSAMRMPRSREHCSAR